MGGEGVGGAAVEPAGEGEAGAVYGQDFVFHDVAVLEWREMRWGKREER